MSSYEKQLNFLDSFDDVHNVNMKNLIAKSPADPHKYFDAPDHDYGMYDYHAIAISTGKDCLALLCDLLMSGVDPKKIIAIHHSVDGEKDNPVFFDWHYIDDYFQKLCARLGIQMAYAYLNGGIKGELLKDNAVSKDITIIKPNGIQESFGRPMAKKNVRRKFPQLSGSLATRWCSSILKIEPGNKLLRSMDYLFIGKKVAFHTGERRSESIGRSRYYQVELQAVDTARRSKNPKIDRYVDHVRPVLNFSEEEVWDTLKNFDYITPSGEHVKGLLPPPAYALFGRSSCALCIFNSDRAFATLHQIQPERIEMVSEMEVEFGLTIARPKKNQAGETVLERALRSEPLPYTDEEAVAQCFKKEFTMPIFASEEKREWKIPFGAYGTESCGAA